MRRRRTTPYEDTSSEYPLSHEAILQYGPQFSLELAIETIPCTHSDPLSNVKRAFEHDPRLYVALDTEFLALHDQLDAVFTAFWL